MSDAERELPEVGGVSYVLWRVGFFLRGFRWSVLRWRWPFVILRNREIARLFEEDQ